MITKAQVKHIQALEEKKYRDLNGQFVVEGDKMVAELLGTEIDIQVVYALQEWIVENEEKLQGLEIVLVETFELERISSLKTPNKVLAVASIPVHQIKSIQVALILDGIQDPGNVGSIIRIADWYKVDAVYCSASCADTFNAKVIQASMGSVFRVPVIKCNLEALLNEHKQMPCYAAILDGKDINSMGKINKGFILIGNESIGISKALIGLSSHKISIQRKGKAESLNAAVAAGIICHCLLS